ncbi:hypothetical protein AC1031_005402 [Aphanomyces cochlioides]|nr:hypothetical protein AC1031_005402 [Aphanomyces cochlioides]
MLVRRFTRRYATAALSHKQRVYTSPYPPLEFPQRTTWDLVHEVAQAKPDATAFICGVSHATMSFGEFDQAVQKTATSLAQRGVTKGTIVLTNLINCMEYPILFHALTSLGAILSPASPTFSSSELIRQLVASNASYLVTHVVAEEAAIEAANAVSIAPERRFVVGKSTSSLEPFHTLQQVSSISVPKPEINHTQDVNYLPFSSGTTGPPKGVQLSFANLAVNVLQWNTVDPFIAPALGLLPYNHIYGTTLMNTALFCGQPQVMLPRFDPATFLDVLQRYNIVKCHIAPPIAGFLAKHPLVDEYDLSATKILISAAAPMGEELEQALTDRLGMKIKQGFGMTELSPCANYAHDDNMKSSSTGQMVPNTELRVVCPTTGKDLPPNTTGELWYRGPQVMLGYLNNPEANKATLTSCGFLKTGDLGYIDEDGHVFVVDRLKELIKYKGHQVAPAELEDVIIKHPKVFDVACIRGYNEDGEEVPKACVVVRPGHELAAEDLMAYVETKVSPFKKVRQVVFVDAIPKSPSGKILRRELQLVHGKKPNEA